MPIALIAVGLAIDLGEIVPHANEVLMLAALEHLENARVGGHGCLREGRGIAERVFFDGHGAE